MLFPLIRRIRTTLLDTRSNLSSFHQRGFFESDFLSEQKNLLEDLLFLLLTSQEEAA